VELTPPAFDQYVSEYNGAQYCFRWGEADGVGEYRCFFVLERPDPLADVTRLVDSLNKLLEYVLAKDFGIDFNVSIGLNCQACYTSSRVQLVFDLVVPGDLQMLTLATRMEARVRERANDFAPLLYHTKSPYGDALVETCAINKEVYCKTASGYAPDLPMLYSLPLGYTAILKPFATSSKCAFHHIIHPYAVTKRAGQQMLSTQRMTSRHFQLLPKMPVQEVGSSQQLTTLESARFIDYISGWEQCETIFKTKSLKLANQGRSTLESNNVITGLLAKLTRCPYSLDTKCTSVCIDYHKHDKRAFISCFSESCRQIIAQKGYITMSEEDTELAIHDRCFGTTTLHTQQDNIAWDECYDLPHMKDLPCKPLVCVRAAMGLGKTVALKNMLDANIEKDTKVLVITFSRNLANKLHNDLSRDSRHTFTNYQTVKGPLNQARIVVCLDSLDRVITRNFHYVIIDEAISVFLHFNSECMKKASMKTDLLELIVRQAECAVYFVDAALDMTFMKRLIDYFATAKMATPYWIWNKHVRDSGRQCQMLVSSQVERTKIEESSLMMRCAKRTLQLLNEGKRVVVCSSLKKFATMLKEYISVESKDTVIGIYTSDTDNSDLENVDSAWTKYDLLVYSPSVSAGVSFTIPHYDVLVAFLVNAHYAPSVDIAIQQLYRVRILKQCNMYLYIHDTQSHKVLPWTSEDIDIQLRQSVAVANSYCDPKSSIFYDAQMMVGDVIKYDPNRMSYHVITGIISTQNRSAMHYTTILKNTLAVDYGIDVTDMIERQRVTTCDVEALQQALDVTKVPAFADIVQLDTKAALLLKENMNDASTAEKAALRLYGFQTLYGIAHEAIDEKFYTEYAMPSHAIDTYFQLKRFDALRTQTLDQNLKDMGTKIKEIMQLNDPSMEYYKSRALGAFNKLVLAQELCNELLTRNHLVELQTSGKTSATCSEAHVTSAFLRFFGKHTKHDVLKTFNLRAVKSDFSLLTGILRVAFKMQVDRGAPRSTRPGFDQLTFACKAYEDISKYQNHVQA
jgi:hypothetical protein